MAKIVRKMLEIVPAFRILNLHRLEGAVGFGIRVHRVIPADGIKAKRISREVLREPFTSEAGREHSFYGAAMRVLIVEDEVIIALDLVHQLKAIGCDVISIVTSGEEAFRVVKASIPDLVIMDIKIKGRYDGLAVAQELAHHYRIPIIFISAYSDEKTKSEVKISKPYVYIHKPFTREALEDAIETLSGGSDAHPSA